MSNKISRAPSVLAIQRGLNVSDGVMSSILEDGSTKPIKVVRHGIRGVLGARAASATTGKDSNSNIQITESAKTDPLAVGLRISTTIRPIDLTDSVFACNDNDYKTDLISSVIEASFDSPELLEVCERYAYNILSGGWVWRNATLGKLNVIAEFDGQTATGEGLAGEDFSPTSHTKALGQFIHDCFTGGDNAGEALIEVTAEILGKMPSLEVFPSQNMATNKPKGFARPLYKINPISSTRLSELTRSAPLSFADTIVMGDAAIRDQKIGNKIRTIDTWHGDENAGAIPIEPNGASLRDNKFYRQKTNDAYAIFDDLNGLMEIASKESRTQEESDTLKYALAMVIRGAVLSSDKDKKSDAKAA